MIIGCPQDYDGWRTGIDDWTRLFLDVEPDLDRDLLRAGLVERARLSTVCGSRRPRRHKGGHDRGRSWTQGFASSH
jgi:hypothetical protein